MVKKVGLIVGVFVLSIGLMACNGQEQEQEDVEKNIDGEASGEIPSIEEIIDINNLPDPVATVNGESIDKETYVMVLEQQMMTMAQYGISLEGEEGKQMISLIEEQTIEQLINEQLLQQAATEKEIEVSEEEIDEELAFIVAQFSSEEALMEALEEGGSSMDELREEIEHYVRQQKYVEEETEAINVTEEEIQARYEEEKQYYTEDELPTFEELQSNIEQRLIAEKEQEQLEVLFGKLRDEGDITVHI
ncbi:SurA N-terminal domain-containing protein [Halalkalibacterium halodurans]|uniref:SurA N-terminal domain-containing protein n=1 Tax=Halalkalibacterium halodurans TaxID=86665 RepID=UPI002E21838A|nr:SurA N-terminal domain-containing protein [Halalkalibacterium halodurans]